MTPLRLYLASMVQHSIYQLAAFQFERACEAYRRGEVSLSRAAEMADISYRDMLLRMTSAGLELNYDAAALAQDLAVTLPAPKRRR